MYSHSQCFFLASNHVFLHIDLPAPVPVSTPGVVTVSVSVFAEEECGFTPLTSLGFPASSFPLHLYIAPGDCLNKLLFLHLSLLLLCDRTIQPHHGLSRL